MTALPAEGAPVASHRAPPSRPAAPPHVPVLLDEVMRLLAPGPGARVLDCTLGAGGHARALAAAVGPGGELVAVDRDPEAGAHIVALAREAPCPVRLIRANFADALAELAVSGARFDAVLMDLGLSSMQVDRAERGFSYSRQAPLDMRMDPGLPRTAADVVAEASERDLSEWFRDLGEERHARSIARAVVRRRAEAPITTTGDLVEVIRGAVPTQALFAGGHPAKRVFQALRIVVNDELGSLERGLPAAFAVLAPTARLGVIAFHSLEDRIVKRFMRERARGCTCPPELPACVCGRVPEADLVTTRAVRPTPAETVRNPRARSARLRVLVRRPGGEPR